MTRSRRSTRLVSLTGVAVLSAVAGALATVPHAASAASTAVAAVAAPRAATFASPTVVDNYRPGFEPDVAVDRSNTAGAAGRLYTSTPFGFSTTMSFIERSDDAGDSFHQIEANFAGKPSTCIGGGDTESQVDPTNGSLYFADLQGLTNYSNSRSDDHGASFTINCASVTTPVVDRQWIGLDTNGGKTSVGAAGGRAYFDYDNVEQSAASPGSNELVINQSIDGSSYGSACVVATGTCAGPATTISPDEGLPGNLIVDDLPGNKYQHSVYAAHTNGSQSGITVSICRGAASGVPADAATAANYCLDPTADDLTTLVSSHWHDVAVDIPDAGQVDKAFNVITQDTAGNLYMTWASAPIDGTSAQTAPAQVYLSTSTDGGEHWSPRIKINNPTAQATNIYPWITAGDPGRIDIAWYGTTATTGATPYDSDGLTGLWDVWMAQSVDALDPAPAVTISKVSDHYVKYGNISTGGTTGGADRSLGDYMQVQTGRNGEAILSYVDDTSTGRNPDYSMGTGETPSEAAGPTMIAKQIGGVSLYNSVGDLGTATAAIDSVTAPTGNAAYYSAGSSTAAPAAQDLTGVSVSRPDATHLTFTLKTNDPNLTNDLNVSPTLGGPTGVWMVRWAERYEANENDGVIRYVALQSTAGGAPEFYTGVTTCIATTRCKFFSYPTTMDVPGAINGGTISWTVPLSAIGSPVNGNSLYSVTGTSASQLLPSTPPTTTLPTTGDPANTQLPNTLDEAPSFSYTLRAATTTTAPTTAPTLVQPTLPVVPTGGTKPTTKPKPKPTTKPKPTVKASTQVTAFGPIDRGQRFTSVTQAKGTLAFTGLDVLVPVGALGAMGAGLVLMRRRRRTADDES